MTEAAEFVSMNNAAYCTHKQINWGGGGNK
jgi:hypothetical protein